MRYLLISLVILSILFFALINLFSIMDTKMISNFRSVLEVMYFLGGISLAVTGIIALKQLTIAKTDIRIRSAREATTLTANQCQFYSKEIICLLNDIDKEINKLGISLYKEEVTTFSYSDESLQKWIVDNKEKMLSVQDAYDNHSLLATIMNALNYMETFVMSFINGVCDEKMAFVSLAVTYCNTVRNFAPIIALLHKDEELQYSNMIQLYEIWNNRLKKKKVQAQAFKAYQVFRNISKTAASIEDKDIKPLGTKNQ